ncbi:MAG: C1 family peptidase [Polyangia bacterium]
MKTSKRTLDRISGVSGLVSGLLLPVLAGGLLIGCGNAEPEEDLGTVPASMIQDNDAPLAPIEALKKDAPSDESIPFEGKADVTLPTSFDIVNLQTPVKSQGSRGVCSIFSTTGLMESLYKKAGMSNPDFSEQYLQWSVKNQVKAFTNTSGSSDSYNLRAIVSYGIPVESAWPYETQPWTTLNDPACTDQESGHPTICYTNGNPPSAATMAMKYKLPASRYVSTSSIKNVIFEKKTGVLVGLDFFYQAWNHRRSTLPVSSTRFGQGVVQYPNATDKTESNKAPAGHSIQLVGWDDNMEVQVMDKDGKPTVDSAGKPVKEKGFYLFKNSWGTASFGINNAKGAGYGWISYRYIKDYGSANTADPPATVRP